MGSSPISGIYNGNLFKIITTVSYNNGTVIFINEKGIRKTPVFLYLSVISMHNI